MNYKELHDIITGCYHPKCSVKNDKGKHCPEKPTKEINGEPVCERCHENWKHLINRETILVRV